MFERYTEKARRVIFFARYEASQFGSPEIDTAHLLLGLLREDSSLQRWVPNATFDQVRQRVTEQLAKLAPVSTSIDLPLSEAGKHTLKEAATEADRLNHKHIGTEHLFLALLNMKDGLPAKILREAGADPARMREQLSAQTQPQQHRGSMTHFQGSDDLGKGYRSPSAETVEIRGIPWNADYVRDAINLCRTYNFHWHKTAWKHRDVVVHLYTRSVSFDLGLAEDATHFKLLKNGWTKDHCLVCRWELFESTVDADHGTGYTNGQNWLCVECFERFWKQGYFSSSYSDLT
jgi:hypothetical protein